MDHLYGRTRAVWMTKCWKVPLLKHGQGITRRGDHEISVPPATSCDVALAHFKFFADFSGKVAAAVGNRSLLSPESRRYEGPESLVQARLLQSVEAAS